MAEDLNPIEKLTFNDRRSTKTFKDLFDFAKTNPRRALKIINYYTACDNRPYTHEQAIFYALGKLASILGEQPDKKNLKKLIEYHEWMWDKKVTDWFGDNRIL